MLFMKILLKILKNGLTHGIMMKEEEKNHCLQERNKKVIGLMKYEKKRKLITKFATTALKTKHMVPECNKIIRKKEAQSL